MRIRLPQYNSKDYLVLALVLLPVTVIINLTIFGSRYFTDWKILLIATFITGVSFALYFTICSGIAVLMKKRFPSDEQVGLKLGFMILSFVISTGIVLLLLFHGYEKISLLNYRFNQNGFIWSYMGMAVVNIFLTFLMEGIDRYENWKASLKETERLKKAYKQSQLQGLKSQVNPHFLFNSLNSLSSLINEEGEAAETFLDEMSKVYRYMLRNEDDNLVTVETELTFLRSYQHLLNARFGEGLKIVVDINEEDKQKLLPPLTLQVLIENAFSQNIINKNKPLVIEIRSCNEHSIVVKNNRQPKLMTDETGFENGVDNLILKYELLNQASVFVNETATTREVILPLLGKTEEVLA